MATSDKLKAMSRPPNIPLHRFVRFIGQSSDQLLQKKREIESLGVDHNQYNPTVEDFRILRTIATLRALSLRVLKSRTA